MTSPPVPPHAPLRARRVPPPHALARAPLPTTSTASARGPGHHRVRAGGRGPRLRDDGPRARPAPPARARTTSATLLPRAAQHVGRHAAHAQPPAGHRRGCRSFEHADRVRERRAHARAEANEVLAAVARFPRPYRDAIVARRCRRPHLRRGGERARRAARDHHEPPLARAHRGRACSSRLSRRLAPRPSVISYAFPFGQLFRDAGRAGGAGWDSVAAPMRRPLLALLAVAGCRRRHRARPGRARPVRAARADGPQRPGAGPRVVGGLPRPAPPPVRFSPPAGAVFGWFEVNVRAPCRG